MGREVGSAVLGCWPVQLFAVYPSFLLHTMQLLKDPLCRRRLVSVCPGCDDLV